MSRSFERILLSGFLFGLCFCMTGLDAHAQSQTPPTPVHRDDVLKGLQVDIEQKKTMAQDLEEKRKQEAKNLSALEQKIIPLSTSIQQAEQNLFSLEETIKKNEQETKRLKKLLNENRQGLSNGLLAAIRLRRIPSESLLLQSASPLKTAQAAMILEHSIPAVQTRISKLSSSANQLARLNKDLKRQRQAQSMALMRLEKEQKQMEGLITARQKVITDMRKDYKLAKRAAEDLSKEAASLKELVQKVRLQNMRAPLPVKKPDRSVIASIKRAVIRPPKKKETLTRALEQAPAGLPVSGKILVDYDAPDEFGAKTQGLKIQTRPNGLVTAPMAGKVRFAGEFKNYGQIVIIEHADGWYSMIGGLSKIQAIVGQSVKKNAPLGSMSSQSDLDRLVLYYELRYKGKPVNPLKKIKDLS